MDKVVDEIKFPELFVTLSEVCDAYTEDYRRQRVLRIFIKCLRHNKGKLAAKIAAKHKTLLTTQSDMSVAMSYSLLASPLGKTIKL